MDRGTVPPDIFLDDDRIGAIGQGRARRNANGHAGFATVFETAARSGFPAKLQGAGGIGTAHGIAVHRRGDEGRLVAPGGDIVRQHPSKGRLQRHRFARKRTRAGQHRGARLRDGRKAPEFRLGRIAAV